jgi:hypothetical protein
MKTLIIFIAPNVNKKTGKSFRKNKPEDTEIIVIHDPSVKKLKIKVYSNLQP